MKVAILQYDIKWEDKEVNKKKILMLLDSNKMNGVDWLILPEMTLTGFSMDTSKTTLTDGDIEFFKDLATKYSCFISFGGVVNKNNRSITVAPSREIKNEYSKIHLFSYASEREHYNAGRLTEYFDIKDMVVMPCVCYDLRFPYLFWDNAGDTDVFFVIASWPSTRTEHWRALLKARAIENQSYMIGVNRIGRDAKLSYDGASCVYGPFGEEILDCKNDEGVFTVELKSEEVQKIRAQFPFHNDRLK